MISVRADVGEVGTNDRGCTIVTEVNRCSKAILGQSVTGNQLHVLGPRDSGSCKHIGRSSSGGRSNVIEISAPDQRIPVTADRDRVSQAIVNFAVRSHDFGLLRPRTSGSSKHRNRSGITGRANVIEVSADHQRVSVVAYID